MPSQQELVLMTVAKMLKVCRAVFPSGPSQLAAVLSKETSPSHHVGPDNSLLNYGSGCQHSTKPLPALTHLSCSAQMTWEFQPLLPRQQISELNRHFIKKTPSIPMFQLRSCCCTCLRSVHIKASRVMWGSKTRCSPGVSLYLMVPQEF